MRAAKIDRNQPEIVKALREAGASVQILSTVGRGCPDLLVGFNTINHLIEVKMPEGKKTDDQVKWHREWNGTVRIAHSADEALRIIKP